MTMFVGICEIEIFIPHSHSLKEKRLVTRSIRDKIAKRFNVSIAEIGYQDKWQRALFGIAKVSTDEISVNKVYDFIDKLIAEDGRAEIIRWDTRFV